jgi:molybdenum cofactor cytidylyltransferase
MQSIAVIPAAGESRRMGQPKLLLTWRGKAIIEHVLEAWRASRVTHVVMVVRAEDAALAEAASRYEAALVRADPPPVHMKDSVARGLAYAHQAYAPGPCDVWLLAPADMPRLSPSIIDRLLDEHNPARPQILVPRVGPKNGHPVLFPWSLASEVERLGPHEGINILRDRFPRRALVFDDCSAFADLDTPQDFRQLPE